MRDIIHEDYAVHFDSDTTTVTCTGRFRLRGRAEYAPIVELLESVRATKPGVMTLDLRELRFLNSSGINMLSKLMLRARKQKDSQMVILCSKQIPWQRKSLPNLQRFLPSLELKFMDE